MFGQQQVCETRVAGLAAPGDAQVPNGERGNVVAAGLDFVPCDGAVAVGVQAQGPVQVCGGDVPGDADVAGMIGVGGEIAGAGEVGFGLAGCAKDEGCCHQQQQRSDGAEPSSG